MKVPRRQIPAACLLLVSLMAACSVDTIQPSGGKTAASPKGETAAPTIAVTAKPSGTTAGGTVETGGTTTTPSPTPSPSPTASPTPTPDPTPVNISYSVKVTAVPTVLTLNVPSPTGTNDAGYISSSRIKAEVLLNDASTESAVTWSTSNAAIATVDSTGLVLATGTGSVLITATATDSRTFKKVSVTVTGEGDLSVTLE